MTKAVEKATAPPAERAPAVIPDKPLTPQQQKNLKEIIEGDFMDLRDRTRYELRNQLDKRVAEIDAEFDDSKKLQAAKVKLDKAHEKAKAIMEKAEQEILASGVIFEGNHRGGSPQPLFSLSIITYGLVVRGRNEAIERAQAAANRVQQTADLVINRRHREADRQVLLSGITAPSGAEIVNGLPKAADIIGEVTAEIALNNEDDLKELHLN